MNREELKALGLTDEQIEEVMRSHGKSVKELKEKVGQVDGLEAQIDDYKEQLEQRDIQLEELKKVDAEGLQAKIDELQQTNETTKTEYEEQLEQQKKELTISNAIQLALNAQVHDIDLASTLIDKEKLVIGDDGKVIGLDEQVDGLKESKAFLFKQEQTNKPKPNFTTGNHVKGSGSLTKEQIMSETDTTKRQQLIKENSHLFK